MNEVGIFQMCDGFRVEIYNADGVCEKAVHVADREDSVEHLGEIFDYYGIKNFYEEVC